MLTHKEIITKAQIGQVLSVTPKNGTAGLYEVAEAKGTRGCRGDTLLTLRRHGDNSELRFGWRDSEEVITDLHLPTISEVETYFLKS